MSGILRKFARDKAGNFAMALAVLMIPIALGVGSAVDYGMASRVRSDLQAAADAAAVGSVAVSSPAFQAAGTMSADGPIDVGITDAKNLFNAQVSGDVKADVTSLGATVTKTGTEVSSVVTFKASVPTHFMQLAGYHSISVSGSSAAKNGTPAFSDFYILLDNSPSMGLGATPNDISTMENNTPDKCAFACHTTQDASQNYYQIAQNLGVTMRMDVVRQAVAQLMDTATRTETYPDQFEMALYDFGASADRAGLTRYVKLTSKYKKKITNEVIGRNGHSPNIDLMTIPYQNYNNDQQTDFNSVLSDMNKEIPDPGSGTNQNSRLKYLFFVSDGVADYSNSSSCQERTTGDRCQEPINTAYCDALKKRGIKIAILYTTYYPVTTNSWYDTWIAPFHSDVGTQMESCASTGLYFEVSPTDGIPEAMSALFKKIVSQPLLTN